ncbi:FtsK/SpoIIIE domain-containing protein [Microbacterium sp. SLBN-146]|uniref:FtsK/SpoIIIE domain-containing protein n=1 Tax=Microbacterium sp. SLBN-146 TaxID=2768457 RepID=UPI0011679F91|nr:FtsK/SpoIIIE domain-containing protein [Microbacterium sp. SLBN-146]TQJ32564.1 S-DNA-T family DNA segregation ATPase FtsK/SpoIIIE [Microbacterium sp. SLBN-146]
MSTTFSPRRAVDVPGPLVPPVPSGDVVGTVETIDGPATPEDPLALLDAWSAPARPPVPLVASSVPIVGAVVLWLVTSSPLALVLAALGPLIALASVLDGRRAAHRDRRRHEAEARERRERVRADVDRRLHAERRRRLFRHPDAAGYLVRDGDVWRDVPERGGRIVVGRGDAPSGVRVTGGVGDPESDDIRARAAILSAAPIVIDLAGGVAIVGPPVLAAAVHRALVLQVCLALAPGVIRLVGAGEPGLEWADELPHRHATTGERLSIQSGPLPDADIVIAVIAAGEPLPAGCRTILTVESIDRAHLDHDGSVRRVAVEALSVPQAREIARALLLRARRSLGLSVVDDRPVEFAETIADAPPSAIGGLVAAIGRDGAGVACVDLVADGPHAVVSGVTGAGKSELLITWVLSMAATHATTEVSFLLADFKGGTAFDALRPLPHVAGVITDLDGSGARRAIESLRAEVRWRESELARHGARDVRDPRVEVPRLVVVVDEFAALLGEHPELHAVFTDVAARGRALGIHLVLGTHRVSGVVRDSLLANCPLRLSLRVSDPADSRAIIGVDDAAHLPGDVQARGVALVRRPSDHGVQRIRVALSSAADIARVAAASRGPRPRRPWLPDLPRELALDELTAAHAIDERTLVLGLSDEPERQTQRVVGVTVQDRGLLVLGGPGAGKSTALALLAGQAAEVIEIPPDGEGAWDAVTRLAESSPIGGVIVIDDLDTLASRVSADYASMLIERMERVIRSAGDSGCLVIASAQRLSGPAARLGELFPRRLVLGFPSRADHIAVGGDPATFTVDAPAGRGRLERIAVQVALPAKAPHSPLSIDRRDDPCWHPDAALTGLVTRHRSRVRDLLPEWAERGIRCVDVDAYVADPAVTADGRVVIVGDPDEWQREWRLLASVRADHDLVIDTTCALDYRVLTSSRELPPFARPGEGRAWIHRAGADPVRIVLFPADVRSDRRGSGS